MFGVLGNWEDVKVCTELEVGSFPEVNSLPAGRNQGLVPRGCRFTPLSAFLILLGLGVCAFFPSYISIFFLKNISPLN